MAKLPPAEKVARAAAKIVDALPVGLVDQLRATTPRGGRSHFVTNARLIALADAVEEWKKASPGA